MRIRPAQAHESCLVADLLTAAAESLVQRGQALWASAEVSEAAVRVHVETGMYHVAFDDEGPIGVFRFQLEDPYFWPEVETGSSAFVHKMAVHPHRQRRGVAQLLLHHACELARQRGRRFLRLDCVSGRPKLRAVYQNFGFVHHSQKQIGRQVFDRFEFQVGEPDA